ncbi:MAG TPA: DUF1194 domain-containing protein [Pseudolabrys sp.]|uniref:DUF1194 domain-containing protein n=1 Tax=Pseudolabrys sp. TaxID=1960880 RepID=UPI002DDD32F8|nr:DUF1194 domain-containing protein [Pseudolabrys sp.]HEV2629271.1 DUF1194 domain-containing protein [Pseudolabrys sp.]
MAIAAGVLLGPPMPARAQTVDAAVALAADVSRSIDEDEFKLQRQGYAAAITSKQFLAVLASMRHGAVALCFIEWAGIGDQTVVVDWTVVRDRDSAEVFAKRLLDAPRSSSGRTAIGDGIDFAVKRLAAAKFMTERQVIDVSGDGTSNSGRAVSMARDEAVEKGITINGLAIINEKTGGEFGTYLYAHTHPPGGLQHYYHDNVIGGPGAFVLQIVNFDAFAQAMTDKLVAEVSMRNAPRRRASLSAPGAGDR